jgi:photosystem II stability/assembly factor-like uncharacterized protein
LNKQDNGHAQPQAQSGDQSLAKEPSDAGTSTVDKDAIASKRLWAAAWALLAMVVSAVAFWFAHTQPATSDIWAPPAGFWSEFWQPKEVNRWRRPFRYISSAQLESVAFYPNGKNAIAVGEGGVLLSSVDAGKSWLTGVSSSKVWLYSVAVSNDGKTALAVGKDGTILSSADIGKSWQTIPSGSNAVLMSVAFSANSNNALAVGQDGAILSSTDTGKSWHAITSGTTEWLHSVAISSDGKTALAVGREGTILSSADAGKSWQPIVSGSKKWLVSVSLSRDGNTALAVGQEGTVLSSADAGKSWQIITSGSSAWLMSVAISRDGKTALVVGDMPKILSSTDGGKSWQTAASDNNVLLRSVALSADGKTAMAVGDVGTVLSSLDAGKNWQTVVGDSNAALSSVALSTDGKTALVVSVEGRILTSSDAGKVWQIGISSSKARLHSVAISSDGKTALTVGEEGTILSSVDAGRNWQSVASGSKARLVSVAFSSKAQSALAVGPNGTILRSADAGKSWKSVASSSKSKLISVAFSSDGKTALAVGEDSTILSSVNAGESWQPVTTDNKGGLRTVAFSGDGKTAIALNYWGRVMSSEDAGESWQTVASANNAGFNSLALGADGKNAFAVSQSGRIFGSADTGKSWQILTNQGEALNSIALSTDSKISLAVGNSSTVLSSLDAGKSWQSVAHYSKGPGSWYMALLVVMAAGCLAAGRLLFWPLKIKQIVRDLMNKGVTDNPIDKPDQDSLAFMPVVEALSRFLRHSATNPPLSIAINAPWGMGKSSFMKLLAGSLRALDAKPVEFNVWHHQHEEVLLAPLLQAIISQAIPSWWCMAGWRFRVRLWWQRVRGAGWAFWLGTLAPLTVPAYVGWLAWRVWGEPLALPLAMIDRVVRDVYAVGVLLTAGPWQASAKNGSLGDLAGAALMAFRGEPLNALLVLGLVLFVAAWLLLMGYTLRAFPASPAILVASMEKRFSLSQAEAQTDFRQRFRRHFGQVARALQPQTMVIFIDDLDRCKPEKAAELLEAVNYLCDAGPCFVILGVAREIVEAQVANAHKVVAQEQAAMGRVRLQTEATEPVNLDADRLQYAQKYLRKLIQLDISLPRMDEVRSFQLLMGKLAPSTTQAQATTASAARRSLDWQSGFLAILLMASAAIVYWRTMDTLHFISNNRTVVAKKLEKRAVEIRAEVEEARLYTNWLLSKQDTKTKSAEQAAMAVANAEAFKLPMYKTKFEMMQTVVRDMEAGLVLLEREAKEGQRKTFVALEEKLLSRSRAVFSGYTQLSQINGQRWEAIKLDMLSTATAATESSTTTSFVARPSTDDMDKASPTAVADQKDVEQRTPLEYLVASFLPAMLLLWFVYFRAKDDYTVEPTPEYEAAVKVWQIVLLENPDTATPRELKRFMNLSRYTVARLQTAAADPQKLAISEARVVELCAKWVSKSPAVSPQDLERSLSKDGATEDEVKLFLQIVGDMKVGTDPVEAKTASPQ